MITSSERAVWEVFYDLPWQSRDVVKEWLAVGYGLRDALLNSNVLGKDEPRTPRDARREELWQNDQRQAAEHEAAHAVCAEALGLNVRSVEINANGTGKCIFAKGATKLQQAIILIGPELWITYFRRDRWPNGPTGLKSDHRQLAEIGDEFVLRQAMDHCMEILKQNRAILLATADRLERHGSVLKPW